MKHFSFDPAFELRSADAEKLAREIVIEIVETSRMMGLAKYLDIDPGQKLKIAKCAIKTFGKVKGEEIEERIKYLISQVKIVKKTDLLSSENLPKWK